MKCTPHDPRTGCAVALICNRCNRCFGHCTCPPEQMRSINPEALLAQLRRNFQAFRGMRSVRFGCSH